MEARPPKRLEKEEIAYIITSPAVVAVGADDGLVVLLGLEHDRLAVHGYGGESKTPEKKTVDHQQKG